MMSLLLSPTQQTNLIPITASQPVPRRNLSPVSQESPGQHQGGHHRTDPHFPERKVTFLPEITYSLRMTPSSCALSGYKSLPLTQLLRVPSMSQTGCCPVHESLIKPVRSSRYSVQFCCLTTLTAEDSFPKCGSM